jgi:outer membrane protein assembly factor BamA
MPPVTELGDLAPSGATTQPFADSGAAATAPSPSNEHPLQLVDAAVSGYADHAAPVIPPGGSIDDTVIDPCPTPSGRRPPRWRARRASWEGRPPGVTTTTLSGLGLHAQWDTRDSQFYPRKGHLADAEATFHDPAIGDDFSYQGFKGSYNQYLSLASNQVLALRAMAQFENGDVPSFALSQFGRGPGLRGYRVGQFQDKQMFATQAEYRLEISKRFGVVAFAGVGEVMPSLDEVSLDDLLPSAGAGSIGR